MNFSSDAKRKFAWEILRRYENKFDTHAHVPFSARAKIPFRLITWTSCGFFSPGLNLLHGNRHFNFKRISFRTQAEISAWLTGLEFANVITPNNKSSFSRSPSSSSVCSRSTFSRSVFSRSFFSRSAFSRHPL